MIVNGTTKTQKGPETSLKLRKSRKKQKWILSNVATAGDWRSVRINCIRSAKKSERMRMKKVKKALIFLHSFPTLKSNSDGNFGNCINFLLYVWHVRHRSLIYGLTNWCCNSYADTGKRLTEVHLVGCFLGCCECALFSFVQVDLNP